MLVLGTASVMVELRLLIREVTRRVAKNTICPRRATKGHKEHLLSTEGRGELQPQNHLSAKGYEGPRRTASVVREECPLEMTGTVVGGHLCVARDGRTLASSDWLLYRFWQAAPVFAKPGDLWTIET